MSDNTSNQLGLPKVTEYPAAFENIAAAHNAAMDKLDGVLFFTSSDGTLNITTADGNTDFTAGPGLSTGGGLPAGYTFEEFTICDSGTPATRWWPTWTANPEAPTA